MSLPAYTPFSLPLDEHLVNCDLFFDELVNATVTLRLYEETLKNSKLDRNLLIPTLKFKEAVASSLIEGTMITIDGVLSNLADPQETNNTSLFEVLNYCDAIEFGAAYLKNNTFSNEFFWQVHQVLMKGEKNAHLCAGEYRSVQNYVGTGTGSNIITKYVPPTPDVVPSFMNNLINYINRPKDNLRTIVQTAIIHAQFETIHPFNDGNGRVGRILIPLYLYYTHQIGSPFFFISDALEKDRHQYYELLNNTRTNNDWNSWIRFFLNAVTQQGERNIRIISEINSLYEYQCSEVLKRIRSTKVIQILNAFYKNPVSTVKQVVDNTGLSMPTVNRLLNEMVRAGFLKTNDKARYRLFTLNDVLNIIR